MNEPILKQWRGDPVYGCPHCQFDSHDRATVVEHIQWIHKPKAQPPVAAAPVAKRVKVEAVAAPVAVNGEEA